MKKVHTIRCAVALAAVVLFNLASNAQTPVYHPGQTLRITITFEGPDANKVTGAAMSLNTSSSSLPAQSGFLGSIYSGDSKQTAPNTFEISYQIPSTQATGDYALNQLRAFVKVNGNDQVTMFYQASTDFPSRTFKIDNPATVDKPKIKDVMVP